MLAAAKCAAVVACGLHLEYLDDFVAVALMTLTAILPISGLFPVDWTRLLDRQASSAFTVGEREAVRAVKTVASVLTGDMLRRMEERPFISAADLDRMTPQERADAFNASILHSWDEVPEPFRSKVFAEIDELAKRFGNAS